MHSRDKNRQGASDKGKGQEINTRINQKIPLVVPVWLMGETNRAICSYLEVFHPVTGGHKRKRTNCLSLAYKRRQILELRVK